jgi:Domain of unknown function (DUF4431)
MMVGSCCAKLGQKIAIHRLPAMAGVLALSFAAAKANSECFDLSKSEPHSLTGFLSHRIFAGPPNFQDVNQGDTPEPEYILKLSEQICLTGDEFADPKKQFLEVQVVESDKTANAMRSLLNRKVTVELESPMAAENGHHHRPLVAFVTAVFPADDMTAEYGTAATAVRGFYYALASGSGDEAAKFIVPEKRRGPFSARQMTNFYGSLVSPLKLLGIQPAGPDRYFVRYAFKSSGGRCNGRAVVNTVTRGGLNFIASIQALDGC